VYLKYTNATNTDDSWLASVPLSVGDVITGVSLGDNWPSGNGGGFYLYVSISLSCKPALKTGLLFYSL
jgi:hypothetical protein